MTLRIIGFYRELRDLHLRCQSHFRVVVGTLRIKQRREQADKILVGGGSGVNENPSSGSDAGSCSSNPTSKAAPEVMNYGLGSPPKTKKQKALEKMKRELKESIEEEDKINAQRKKEGKASLTLIIKDGIRFFAFNDQL